jgi:hypothetical protein
MPNGTPLLNEDGTASMATAFLSSHHGLRRDLARFAIALRELHGPRVAALQEEWTSYHQTLHGHHSVEDQSIFPDMRTQHPALAEVIDRLVADHRRIDPMLADGDRAFAGLPASLASARAVVAELASLLADHLATEEQHLVPHLRGASSFPSPANDAEADMYAGGFAWSMDGIAPDILDRLDVMLPESVKERLPAARAAFAARCARVWGHTIPGASRTSIPDWMVEGAS